MRNLFLLPILIVSLAACGERKEPEAKIIPADTHAVAAEEPIEPLPPPRDTGFNPNNVESFEKMVYMEYGHVGTQVSRRVMDSIIRANMRSGNSMRIEEEMNRYMRQYDTTARAGLAAKYQISLDSLNRIIARRAALAK